MIDRDRARRDNFSSQSSAMITQDKLVSPAVRPVRLLNSKFGFKVPGAMGKTIGHRRYLPAVLPMAFTIGVYFPNLIYFHVFTRPTIWKTEKIHRLGWYNEEDDKEQIIVTVGIDKTMVRLAAAARYV
jgi:hypothetical protein